MEGELQRLWVGLSLIEHEEQVVVVDGEEIEKSLAKDKLCLLALTIANKVINREVFRTTMSRL